MSKQRQAQSATTRIDVITPSLGPVPAIYVRIRRPARPVRSK
jgi:hypothetical protein